MTTKPLGDISSPLLICGGAYGNLEALEALVAFQRSLAIPDTNVIHTGDAVAYCADTEAAVQLIASRNWHAIKGNVEEQIAAGAADCGCGFEAGSVCDTASQRWYAHALATLSVESKAWIASLPTSITFSMSGLRTHVVHGSVRQTNRFLFASSPASEFIAELNATDADIVVAGHTGIPFTQFLGNRCWHNSGALGMPANDGTQRVWVSVLAPQAEGISIRHHALEFNPTGTAAKIRTSHLPTGYADGLLSGLWPSLDVLPDAEKRQTGTPLEHDGLNFIAKRPTSMAAEQATCRPSAKKLDCRLSQQPTWPSATGQSLRCPGSSRSS